MRGGGRILIKIVPNFIILRMGNFLYACIKIGRIDRIGKILYNTEYQHFKDFPDQIFLIIHQISLSHSQDKLIKLFLS